MGCPRERCLAISLAFYLHLYNTELPFGVVRCNAFWPHLLRVTSICAILSYQLGLIDVNVFVAISIVCYMHLCNIKLPFWFVRCNPVWLYPSCFTCICAILSYHLGVSDITLLAHIYCVLRASEQH